MLVERFIMKRIHGKLLELLLFFICLVLFVILLPRWLLLFCMSGLFCICVGAMIKTDFFGHF